MSERRQLSLTMRTAIAQVYTMLSRRPMGYLYRKPTGYLYRRPTGQYTIGLRNGNPEALRTDGAIVIRMALLESLFPDNIPQLIITK